MEDCFALYLLRESGSLFGEGLSALLRGWQFLYVYIDLGRQFLAGGGGWSGASNGDDGAHICSVMRESHSID